MLLRSIQNGKLILVIIPYLVLPFFEFLFGDITIIKYCPARVTGDRFRVEQNDVSFPLKWAFPCGNFFYITNFHAIPFPTAVKFCFKVVQINLREVRAVGGRIFLIQPIHVLFLTGNDRGRSVLPLLMRDAVCFGELINVLLYRGDVFHFMALKDDLVDTCVNSERGETNRQNQNREFLLSAFFNLIIMPPQVCRH